MFTSTLQGRRLRRPSIGAAIALVALVALGGIGYAAIPSSSGVFRGCYAKTEGILLGIPHSKGDVRLVDEGEACRSYETLATWNQQGTPGTPGVSGYEVVTVTVFGEADGRAEATATCLAGKRVLGGTYRGILVDNGYRLTFPLEAVSSQIVSNNTQFWVTANSAYLGRVGSTLEVQATCANVS